jgi:hypothetical protein
MPEIHPIEPIPAGIANGRCGAGRAVPNAKLSDREAPIADFPFLLLVMESAEGEPFQSTGTQLV